MAGLNWDKINDQKKRLDEKLSKSGGSSAAFWKPESGDNEIRIMPCWTDKGEFVGQFWREVAQHWMVSEEGSRRPVICPKSTPYTSNKECPICEFVDALKKDKSVRAQELVKELRAKTTYFLNVVDMNDPEYTAKDKAQWRKERPGTETPFEVGDVKVQIYAAPSTVFNQILNVIKINEQDITDPENGNVVTISKHGKGLTTKYNTVVALKSTPAPPAQELPALDQVGFTADVDKMLDMLTAGPGSEYLHLLGAGAAPALPEGDEAADDDSDALRRQLLEELNG